MRNEDQNLRYKSIARGQILNDDQLETYNQAFKLWKNVFSETFKKVIAENFTLYSDDFLLQDHIGALTFRKETIGVIAYSQINTQSVADIERSYFKNYPASCLSDLKKNHRKVFILSNLALDPSHRKSSRGTPYSIYLIGLGILNFLESDATTLITITRNDRSTHKTVQMFGGMILSENTVHGISSNVISISKEDAIYALRQLDPTILEEIQKLSQLPKEKHMTTFEQTKKEAFATVETAFEHYENINFMDTNAYANWLCQTYYYVHHVTRILAFAASKCDLYQDEELHFRLIKHLSEEKDHDKMLLNDLKSMGLTLEQFPEKMETRNFYQSLFYIVETYGPYSLLGYFMPQEGLACLKLGDLYRKLSVKYGDASCTFLKEHCELDVEHFGDALNFLKRMPENKLAAVKLGMFRSAELYSDIMHAISLDKNAATDDNYWKYSKNVFSFNQLSH